MGALIGESRGNTEDEIKTGILADTTKYLTDDNFGLVLLATEEENSELDEYLKKYDEEIILVLCYGVVAAYGNCSANGSSIEIRLF